MANNKPPAVKIQGFRGSIPSGYLLGRADGGQGDVQLISMAKAQSVGLIPATLPPSGAAGGDLSGTYPNPTVVGLQTRAVSASAPASTNVLAWSGTAWAPLALGAVAYSNSYLDLSNLPPLTGGTTGQVLTKISNTSYDFGWATPAGSSSTPGSAMDDGTNFYLAMIDGAGQLILDAFGDPIWALEVLPASALVNAPAPALTNTHILVGNGSNVATDVAMSGYATLANTGAVTVKKVLGVTDGSDAAAGDDGEFLSSTVLVGSAISLTDGVVANIASITLTPGDWDVNVGCGFTGGDTTSITLAAATIHTSSTTLSNLPGSQFQQPFPGGQVVFNVQDFVLSLGPRRFNVTVNTTIYFNVFLRFTISTAAVYGIIRARRVR